MQNRADIIITTTWATTGYKHDLFFPEHLASLGKNILVVKSA
jgi:hypothetical protein